MQILRLGNYIDARYRDELCVPAIASIADDVIFVARVVVAGEAFRTMTTSDAGLDHYFLACFRPRDEVADFAHNAGHVAPKNVRQRNFDSRQTVTHPHIEMIQRARAHLDQNFIRFDLRAGNVGRL